MKKRNYKWFVYILKCSDKSLYTGITNDIPHRLKEHNRGKGSAYVRSRLPAKLVYKEPCRTKSKALKREAEIKSWPREKKLSFLSKQRQIS